MRTRLSLLTLILTAVGLVGCPRRAPVPLKVDIYISYAGACTVFSRRVPCEDLGHALRGANAIDTTQVLIHAAVNTPTDAAEKALKSVEAAHFTNASFAARTGR